MGYAKRVLDDPAYSADGHFVCAGCFEDPSLKELIRQNAEDERCEYCDGSEGEPVASLHDVVDRIRAGIFLEYGLAVETLPYDSGEGGYQAGAIWDSSDLLEHQVGLELPNDDGTLLEQVAEALGDEPWCEADPFVLPESQRLLASWRALCELVKHGRRYLFLDHEYEGDEPKGHPDRLQSPRQILLRVTALAEELGLIRTIDGGAVLYRARRQRKGERFRSLADLGPPPESAALASRMSPAGVPLLYCSSEADTALRETVSPGEAAAVGRFLATRPLRILDLTAVPAVPSLFELKLGSARNAIHFLRDFARHVSRPYPKRRGEDLLEYIPTQVVTEYVRFVFRPGGEPLDGIRYPSAKVPRGTNLALFLRPKDLGPTGALDLVDVQELAGA